MLIVTDDLLFKCRCRYCTNSGFRVRYREGVCDVGVSDVIGIRCWIVLFLRRAARPVERVALRGENNNGVVVSEFGILGVRYRKGCFGMGLSEVKITGLCLSDNPVIFTHLLFFCPLFQSLGHLLLLLLLLLFQPLPSLSPDSFWPTSV